MTDHPNPLLGDTPFEQLTYLMAKLRDPNGGCPWDREQTFATIAPYTIEVAYEVQEAIETRNMSELKEELGDLLFQVIFHSQMAAEAGEFTINDVVTAINDKMLRRHPHVFGDAEERSSKMQEDAWEAQKASERAAKASRNGPASALDGVASALPALTRSAKIQKRAARTGFDWTNPEDIFDKLHEEIGEVREAMLGQDISDIEEEIGDLLFVAANLARRLKVEPEQALRKANAKFVRRFKAMEAMARETKSDFDSLSLEEQEALWQSVKRAEKKI